jgi:hypothetical protein
MGLKRRGNETEVSTHSRRDLLFSECIRSGYNAQDRQQAAGSDKAKRTGGLQTCRHGQRHQTVGWRLRSLRAPESLTRDGHAILARASGWSNSAWPETVGSRLKAKSSDGNLGVRIGEEMISLRLAVQFRSF